MFGRQVFLCYNFTAMKTLVLAVLLAIVQAAPPSPRQTSDNQTRASGGPNSKTTYGKKTAAHSEAIQQPVEAAHADDSVSKKTDADTPKTIIIREPATVPIKDWWDRTYVLAAVALVLVGAFGAWLARRTLLAIERQGLSMRRQTNHLRNSVAAARRTVRAMREQAEIMHGQLAAMKSSGEQTGKLIEQTRLQVEKTGIAADAAKRNADVATRVSIPTLAIKNFDIGDTGAASLAAILQYPRVRIVIKNYGQTPAFLKWWTIIFICEELPEKPVYSGYPGCGTVLEKLVIESGASCTLPELSFTHRQEIDMESVNAVIAQEKMITAYGYVCYGDLFGNPLRIFRFCETAMNTVEGPPPFIQWVSDLGPAAYRGTGDFPMGQRIS